MKTINVGIIGQGRSGRDIHGMSLIKDPEHYRIVAVAEKIKARRERAAREYQCDTYADARRIMARDDLDMIVNATFSHQHVPLTLDLLNAGFHVVCEKPLARRPADVNRLVAAAKRNRRVLAVFQQQHFAPAFTKMMEVIRSGILGRIVQASIQLNGFSRRWDWQTLVDYDGGNLMNTGPHPLEWALNLLGPGMPNVSCWMDRANTFGDAEDHVKVVLSGKGHPIIDLEISSCCPYPSFSFKLYGTRGGLIGDMSKLEWRYFNPADAPRQRLIRKPISLPDGTPAYCNEQLTWCTGEWPEAVAEAKAGGAYNPQAAGGVTNAVAEFYQQLYATLTEGRPLAVPPEFLRRQAAIIAACHRQNPSIHGQR